jgi:nitrite reductase/ring-hydroxylating ferredoxin subunit
LLTRFVKVATVGDLADGALNLVTAEGEDIVLVRVGNEYFAVAAICSHAFGWLDEGTLLGHEIQCPIHEGRFDVRTGEPTREPAEEPISAYTVRLDGEQILVGPLDSA